MPTSGVVLVPHDPSTSTDDSYQTKTSKIAVVNASDLFAAVTQLQDAVTFIEESLGKIDVSSNSALSKRVALLEANLSVFTVTKSSVEARVAAIEQLLLSSKDPAPVIPAATPSFLNVVITKFQNSWKSI